MLPFDGFSHVEAMVELLYFVTASELGRPFFFSLPFSFFWHLGRFSSSLFWLATPPFFRVSPILSPRPVGFFSSLVFTFFI